jgi:flagellar hook protein FlgE
MTSSANAIMAFQDGLDVTTANVSNAATYGAKRISISFKEVFNRIVSGGYPASFGQYSVSSNPIQFGGQVAVADTRVDFAQGEISLGGNMTVAINGNGLFIVSPDGGTTKYYTRNGDFRLDPVTKNIVDSSGRVVYGYKLGQDGKPDTTQLVPLNAGTETDVGFLPGGILVGNYTAWYNSSQGSTSQQGQQVVAYKPLNQQLALTTFPNINGLLAVDGVAFKASSVSGSPVVPVVSGTDWAGQVAARSLEKSNINISVETVNALEYQRAMNASLTMLKLASDELTNFINRIGG